MDMTSQSEQDIRKTLLRILTAGGNPDERIHQAIAFLREPESDSISPALPLGRSNGLGLPSLDKRTSGKFSRRGGKSIPKLNLIGNGPAMKIIQQSISQVSQSLATVLVRGESGTGKELVARAIHVASDRVQHRFVSVHCAAVPEALIESTLFGYERGAFTGATQRRIGRFEQANGGTLFLDEVGDIPLSTQVKLLRVLQERECERVGGNDTLSIDVRVIAATHRDLEVMVREGSFREDLYYRLNVVPITIPPLRDRQEDIPVLLHHFLEKCNGDNKRAIQLREDVIQLISAYHWPGNIRELQNCVERLVVMATTDKIALSNIPEPLKPYFDHMRSVRNVSGSRVEKKTSAETLSSSLDAIEEDRLKDALRQSGGVKAKAGRMLGLTPRQVAYKMRKYQIAVS